MEQAKLMVVRKIANGDHCRVVVKKTKQTEKWFPLGKWAGGGTD